MPLVSIGKYLKQAQQQHFAVPLFDTFDMYSCEGILAAAEEKHAPVIVALYSGIMKDANIRDFAGYVVSRAKQSTVPVSVMLDHGASFEEAMQAISYGFSDVMYDGSKLALDENIANTRAVVRAAHALGLCAEAEIGHVGQGSDYQAFGAQRKGFTDPAQVERFVAETGVDILAVAIGNAHGLYHGDPNLDIALLREIRSRVEVPLVLHGGTGILPDQFRAAIAAGVAKINIATDLYVTTTKCVAGAVKDEKISYFDLGKMMIESFRTRCGYFLDLFGATGKA